MNKRIGIKLCAAAVFAALGCLTQFAAAQAQPGKLSAQQIAAIRHQLASRPMIHGGGAPLTDPSNGMTVVTPLSATALATTLLGSGVTLSGTPTFQGNAAQAGSFTSAPPLVGFSSGIILSSGNVIDAGSTWVQADSPSTNEGVGGYAPLEVLSGGTTNDAAVLQFSFIPNTSKIYFTYIFASAEYPCCIGDFNDPMGLFVNGTAPSNNVALLPTTPPIGVTINNVNPFNNAQFFNKLNGAGDLLPYGGETKVLTATATVNPGQVNTITLAVADALDHVLDSAVFIQAGSLSTTPPSPTASVPALSIPALLVLGLILLITAGILLRTSTATNRT